MKATRDLANLLLLLAIICCVPAYGRSTQEAPERHLNAVQCERDGEYFSVGQQHPGYASCLGQYIVGRDICTPSGTWEVQQQDCIQGDWCVEYGSNAHCEEIMCEKDGEHFSVGQTHPEYASCLDPYIVGREVCSDVGTWEVRQQDCDQGDWCQEDGSNARCQEIMCEKDGEHFSVGQTHPGYASCLDPYIVGREVCSDVGTWEVRQQDCDQGAWCQEDGSNASCQEIMCERDGEHFSVGQTHPGYASCLDPYIVGRDICSDVGTWEVQQQDCDVGDWCQEDGSNAGCQEIMCEKDGEHFSVGQVHPGYASCLDTYIVGREVCSDVGTWEVRQQDCDVGDWCQEDGSNASCQEIKCERDGGKFSVGQTHPGYASCLDTYIVGREVCSDVGTWEVQQQDCDVGDWCVEDGVNASCQEITCERDGEQFGVGQTHPAYASCLDPYVVGRQVCSDVGTWEVKEEDCSVGLQCVEVGMNASCETTP